MNWFYSESGQQRGPVTEADFQQLVAQGVIRLETLVWNETLPNWQPWSTLSPNAPDPAAVPLGMPAPADGRVRCSECQQVFVPEETVELTGRRVCFGCKPAFLQRIQEGNSRGVLVQNVVQPDPRIRSLTAEEVAAQDYEIDAAGRIGEGWDFLTKPNNNAFVVGFLIFLIFFGIQIAQQVFGLIPILGILFGLVGGAAVIFVIIPMTGGLQLAFLHRLRTGSEISVDQVFRLSFSERYWPMIGVTMLMGLLAGLTFLPVGILAAVGGVTVAFSVQNRGGPDLSALVPLLVVIALVFLISLVAAYFLMTNWAYSLLLVADKRLPVTDALRLSWRVTRRHWWQNFFLLFLVGIVFIIGMIACCIGVLVAQPLTTAARVIQYERLFGRLARVEP